MSVIPRLCFDSNFCALTVYYQLRVLRFGFSASAVDIMLLRSDWVCLSAERRQTRYRLPRLFAFYHRFVVICAPTSSSLQLYVFHVKQYAFNGAGLYMCPFRFHVPCFLICFTVGSYKVVCGNARVVLFELNCSCTT